MNNIALDLGFVQIHWYSICILLGVLFGSLVIISETTKKKYKKDFIINLIFWCIIFGIIGARVYYVLFNLDYYASNVLEIFEIWNGGLAIYGGIIVGLITFYIYIKKYKQTPLKLADIFVVGLILAQAIGRWGNFFNGEAHGSICTLEYLTKMFIPEFIIKGMYINGNYYIPTFYYESIWCLIGFIVLLILRRNKYLKNGVLFGFYLSFYGFGRFFIESMRTDSLMLGNFRSAQIVSVVMFAVGIYFMFRNIRKSKFDDLYNEGEKNELRF